MLTYLTLDGDVLDLSTFSEMERAFFDDCYAAYREERPYAELHAQISGPQNPLLGPSRGRITPQVRQHPLWRAVSDLEDRLGILQGEIGPEPDDEPARDPLADQWIPAVEAAAAKGVTLAGLHKAIERGVVLAKPARPGGVRLLVSHNSLTRWTPNALRQSARRRVATR